MSENRESPEVSSRGPRSRSLAGRVTMADIARRCGLARPTVSLILSGDPRCYASLKTREKVFRAVRELGYIPNRLARSLARGKTDLVGVVAGDFDTMATMNLRWVMRVLEANGRIPVIRTHGVESGPDHVVRTLRFFDELRVDGIVCLMRLDGKVPGKQLPEGFDLPVVAVDSDLENVDSVCVDRPTGARMAVEHLFSLGHRDIAFLWHAVGLAAGTDPCITRRFETMHAVERELARVWSFSRRLIGIRDAYEKAGRTPGPTSFVGVFCSDCMEAAGLVVGELYRRHIAGGLPTAIFAFNDALAAAVIRALHERGIRVGIV